MKAAFTKFLVVFKIFDLERKQKSMYVLKKKPQKPLSFLGKSFLVALMDLHVVEISTVCTECMFLVVSTKSFFNIG